MARSNEIIVIHPRDNVHNHSQGGPAHIITHNQKLLSDKMDRILDRLAKLPDHLKTSL